MYSRSETEILTFSTTWGNALRGIGSARFRFLTLWDAIKFDNIRKEILSNTHLGVVADGIAAASAAAFAKPWSASIGALRLARGRVSSDSSSEEGAVLGTMPYVAYL